MACVNCGGSNDVRGGYCTNCRTDLVRSFENHKDEVPVASSGTVPSNPKIQDQASTLSSRGVRTNKKRRSVLLLAALVLILIIGLAVHGLLYKNSIGVGVTSSGSAQTGFNRQDACNQISQISNIYFSEFDAFRYSKDDGTGWSKLSALSNKAEISLANFSIAIDQGISWDSGPIVKGIVSNLSGDISEIDTSAQNGYFSPGRDLNTILGEIQASFSSLESSSCGSDSGMSANTKQNQVISGQSGQGQSQVYQTSASTTSGVTSPTGSISSSPGTTSVTASVWVPSLKNIMNCDRSNTGTGCPDGKTVRVSSANTFGISAQDLIQKLIDAGICKLPNGVDVMGNTVVYCVTPDSDSIWVVTSDSDIWKIISTGSGMRAGGDGWLATTSYSNFSVVQNIATLLGGTSWNTK